MKNASEYGRHITKKCTLSSFCLAEYTLDVITDGNGVVEPNEGTFEAGDLVQLYARPDLGYVLTSWLGTDDDTSTERFNTVTMDESRIVEVAFTCAITVIKPIGGEVWVSRSKHIINWDSYAYQDNVNILFSSNDGDSWVSIEDNISNDGYYKWCLPKWINSNQCLISVVPTASDVNIISVPSSLFAIQQSRIKPCKIPCRRKVLRRVGPGTGRFKWLSRIRPFRSPFKNNAQKRFGPKASFFKWLFRQILKIKLSKLPCEKKYHKRVGPETGCIKWQFETQAAVSASVTIGRNNRVYIPCEDGRLYTLNPAGSLLWSYDTNSPVVSSPAVTYDGTVYVGCGDGALHAINKHGELLWTHKTFSKIYSSIALSKYRCNIIACSQDGFVYALGRDGSELWDFYTSGFTDEHGSIFAAPVIAKDGTIYVAGIYDPNLYALNPKDGSLKWTCHFADPCDLNRFKHAGWPFAAPAISQDGTIYQTLLYDPNLYAIDAATGQVTWSANMSDTNSGWFEPNYTEWNTQHRFPYHNVSDSGWSEPMLGPDGTIYVSFDDPYLRAVNPDGSIKWIVKLGQIGGFTLTVGSDGLIYAAADDGCLRVINADGEQISKFQADAWLNFPKIQKNKTIIISDGRDNSIFVTDANNIVWAISADCQGNTPDLY